MKKYVNGRLVDVDQYGNIINNGGYQAYPQTTQNQGYTGYQQQPQQVYQQQPQAGYNNPLAQQQPQQTQVQYQQAPVYQTTQQPMQQQAQPGVPQLPFSCSDQDNEFYRTLLQEIVKSELKEVNQDAFVTEKKAVFTIRQKHEGGFGLTFTMIHDTRLRNLIPLVYSSNLAQQVGNGYGRIIDSRYFATGIARDTTNPVLSGMFKKYGRNAAEIVNLVDNFIDGLNAYLDRVEAYIDQVVASGNQSLISRLSSTRFHFGGINVTVSIGNDNSLSFYYELDENITLALKQDTFYSGGTNK